MTPLARFAVTAVAIVVVVGGALVLLSPQKAGVGGPEATSPPAASDPPNSASGSDPLVYRWVQELEAGTYATSLSWDASLRFVFTVGDGWEGRDINLRNGHVSVALYPIRNVATDPCRRTVGEPPLSSQDVMAAIGRVATVEAPATATRVGDREATYLEFTTDPPEACSSSAFGLIELPAQTCQPDVCTGLGGDWYGLEFGAVRHHHRLWVLDVGRRSVAIDAVWTDEATPVELAALQGVIDSVRLETPLATPPPVPAR